MTEIENNPIESLSNVSFESSARGVISFKVKVYHKDPEEAYKKATELMERANNICKEKNTQGSSE